MFPALFLTPLFLRLGCSFLVYFTSVQLLAHVLIAINRYISIVRPLQSKPVSRGETKNHYHKLADVERQAIGPNDRSDPTATISLLLHVLTELLPRRRSYGRRLCYVLCSGVRFAKILRSKL